MPAEQDELRQPEPAIDLNNYAPSEAQMKQAQALIALIRRCDQEDLPVCVFGGYGLDALYGRLTRDHDDFDLLIRAASQPRFVQILEALGYLVMDIHADEPQELLHLLLAEAAYVEAELPEREQV